MKDSPTEVTIGIVEKHNKSIVVRTDLLAEIRAYGIPAKEKVNL